MPKELSFSFRRSVHKIHASLPLSVGVDQRPGNATRKNCINAWLSACSFQIRTRTPSTHCRPAIMRWASVYAANRAPRFSRTSKATAKRERASAGWRAGEWKRLRHYHSLFYFRRSSERKPSARHEFPASSAPRVGSTARKRPAE